MKKVLLLGSGALKIGQAGEFDYSGSQALKALKEEGVKTVLINPNIATIQTSKKLADKIYFLPIDPYFVEEVIKKEKPDGILLSFGGQTALNCGLELEKKEVFKKYKIKILGIPIRTIEITEDRKLFAEELKKIDVKVANGDFASNVDQAVKIAKKNGFPVMLRAGFALGGFGSAIAENEQDLKKAVEVVLTQVSQVVIEEYLKHWKEVEYEVVRDAVGNKITVCNMENMDPLGIHTGDSIVIAPSQTLNNHQYHFLRELSLKVIEHLGIIGECNIQFALDPKSDDYRVIEVNARLSRSSALASKATGYPLAYIAAKLALGYKLPELKNSVTKSTSAFFEPALDYVVVKIPRWDIEKFKGADERIGSSMKSVGEVMGIGRTFEEAFQKAIRMLDLDFEGATSELLLANERTIRELLEIPTPKRMFALAKAIKENTSIDRIYSLTGIDPWFLYRIKNIVEAEKKIPKKLKNLKKDQLLRLKQLGFSDKRIGYLTKTTGLTVRKLRQKLGVLPSVLQIDTLAGEFPAKTNYLYLTYNASHHDVQPAKEKGVIVLGSGPYRIGSSVEFDWTSVSTVARLKKYNKSSIIINCNPETVSTDYDISDKLYFEELTFERIADIYDFEKPFGVIISVGGQTPNNRAASLEKYGVNILGTDSADIDRAEDRSKFSALLDKLKIDQPAWNKFTSLNKALEFCEKEGVPVLIRPSYVLSGTMMRICHTKEELTQFLKLAAHVSKEFPITVSKFIEEAKEIELDAVAQKGEVKISIISEHIENAGVHSGDATIVLPPQKVYIETQRRIEEIAHKLAEALHISGPFNIQVLAKDNNIQVIEVNLRASRTFPFISKVSGVDFIAMAVDAMFEKPLNKVNLLPLPFVAVKVPQFSFARLTGADPILRVEMASTGEVACFGKDLQEAFLKGEIAVGGKIPKRGIFISLGGDENKVRFLENAQFLNRLFLPIYATEKTSRFLQKHGVAAKHLYKIHEKKSPNILDYFQNGKVDMAVNITDTQAENDLRDNYPIRRWAVDYNIPLFTDMKKAALFIKAVTQKNLDALEIKSWDEYVSEIRAYYTPGV